MSLLQEKLGFPVDIEFASDGENFYILQCRQQSKSQGTSPVAIPKDISDDNIIFTANKYISNGKVTGIKTVVYIDPEAYGKLEKYQDLVNIGVAVGELNKILPRRSFILMGPGRWGSRGDIKLGVQVTYSDINNSSLLIEIANRKSKYQPEPSFGTHFFQDLVEAQIKYLPLYPEENGIKFNNYFFSRTINSLEKIIPAYSYLSDVIKVINVPENYYGKNLIVLMNADLEKAVAYIDYSLSPDIDLDAEIREKEPEQIDGQGWKWRHYMAEKISSQLDLKKFSVKGIYLFGSTNTCTARLNSDIDLLIHFNGTDEQKQKLDIWFNGWSKALSEINYLKTGYKSDGLLDIHYITDQDIKDKNSYAAKINSIYDPATPLRICED
jgi:predicted nucleotidyltransferase